MLLSNNADRACLTDSRLILISFRVGGDGYYLYPKVRSRDVCLSVLTCGVVRTAEPERGEEQTGSSEQITEPLPPLGPIQEVPASCHFMQKKTLSSKPRGQSTWLETWEAIGRTL